MGLVSFTVPDPVPSCFPSPGSGRGLCWPEQCFWGGRKTLPWRLLGPSYSCVPFSLRIPCESPSAECLMWERVFARKLLVRQRESGREGVPGGQSWLTHLLSHLESPPLCFLPSPHPGPWFPKPSLIMAAPGLGSGSPSSPTGEAGRL